MGLVRESLLRELERNGEDNGYVVSFLSFGVAIALGFWLWAIAYLWVASADAMRFSAQPASPAMTA